jgi:hypothetical protein
MIRKLRRQFESVKCKKHNVFDDFDGIIGKSLRFYAHLFPNHKINKDGSRVVYHFGVDDVAPISLEKEHGSREYVPRYYAKLAMSGIEDLLTFIENSPAVGTIEELAAEDGEISATGQR